MDMDQYWYGKGYKVGFWAGAVSAAFITVAIGLMLGYLDQIYHFLD